MFTKVVYPETEPPNLQFTHRGEGLLSVNNNYLTPFSILTPSLKFFVPPSPHFFYPAQVEYTTGD